MKTQLAGIGVSLTVHAIAAMLLFHISDGLSPLTKTLVLDLSFKATGPVGMAGTQMEGIHPPHELSMPEGATREVETIPYLPVENTPNAADTGPPPIPPKPKPSEMMLPRPVKPDPPPEPKALEPKKQEPVSQPPPVASDLTKPENQKRAPVPPPKKKESPPPPKQAAATIPESKKMTTLPEAVTAITSNDKEKAPTDRNRSLGDRLAESKTNGENNLSKTMAGQVNSGRGGLSAKAGETFSGSTVNKGGNAYLDEHFGFIRRQLTKSLCYPTIARQRGWSGKVLIAFTIDPDGLVDQMEIKKSCGISLLDKSALSTVRSAGPFPKPPMPVRIIIPILYQLN